MQLLFALIVLAALAIPSGSAAPVMSVQNDFATFDMPATWGVVEPRTKTLRKPTLYLRQRFKVTTIAGGDAVIHVYEQDLPGFRGEALPPSEIDAAFNRVSNLSGDSTALSDSYIPSISEFETATGTLLKNVSREFDFWMQPATTKYRVRLAYASFGKKLYGIEMIARTDGETHEAIWTALVASLKKRGAANPAVPATTTDTPATSKRGERSKLRRLERLRRLQA